MASGKAIDAFAGAWRVASVVLPSSKPAYTGTIHIRRVGSVFDLEWDISDGRYVGIGLEVQGRLFVSCGEQRAGLGIAVLRREPGTERNTEGSIQWGAPALQGAVGSGRFVSARAGGFEGEHEATCDLPDGTSHGHWTLEVERTGDVYAAVWRKDRAVHFRGIGLTFQSGLQSGPQDGLVVGWYPDLEQLAFLDYVGEVAGSNRLLARWGLGGFTTLGSEVLERA